MRGGIVEKNNSIKLRAQLKISLPVVLVVICLISFIMAVSAAVASGADLDEIKKRGVLRHLGIPYANFVTGSGDGMDIELMKLFAGHLGVKYEYVKTDWSNVFSDLTGKKIDTKGGGVNVAGEVRVKGDVAASGITILPWRQKIADFSRPTFPNQVWLVSRADSVIKPIKPTGDIEKDIAAVKKLLKNRSLLGKSRTCLDPSLYNIDATGAKVRLFERDLNELAPAIINGESELTLLDIPDALVALQKWPGRIKVIGPVSPMQDMAAAFPRNSPNLREAFDKFLEKIKRDGTFNRIVNKYYPFVFDYSPDFFRERHGSGM